MRYRQKNYGYDKVRRKFILPHIWLMTDMRMGDALFPAIQKLPAGSGIVFRHYDLPDKERRQILSRVARICARRGHVMILADAWQSAVKRRNQGAPIAGVYIPGRKMAPIAGRQRRNMLFSTGVHDPVELARAQRAGADMIFVSPVFSTTSHPDARPLGVARFAAFAKLAGNMAVIALGGMDGRRAKPMDGRVIYGWAGIDAFLP